VIFTYSKKIAIISGAKVKKQGMRKNLLCLSIFNFFYTGTIGISVLVIGIKKMCLFSTFAYVLL